MKKKVIKSVASLSIAALVMSNFTFVHAEENQNPGQAPIVAEDQGSEAGIKVSNTENFPSSSAITSDDMQALRNKGEQSIKAQYEREQKNRFAKKDSLNVEEETYNPDDKVSVIVQLKGQTVPQLTASQAGVTPMSVSKGKSLVKEEIQSTKNEIMSTLDLAKSGSNGIKFKHEFNTVMKGFSINDIKYKDLENIKSLPNVKAVTIQQKFYPAVNQQHDLTGIKNVWNGSAVGKPTGYKGEGMLIAIVDTGIDFTHEAFPDPKDMSKTRIKTGKFKREDGTTSYKVVDGYDWADQDSDVIPHVELPDSNTSSHGVHVAGIAAGSGPVIQGVAPEAQLIAEKVFSDKQPGALTEDIIKGIDHASSLGADVINMSLGSSSSFDTRNPNDPVGIAIRNATDEGHIVVVAAGNASNAYADRSGGMGQSIKIGQTPDLNKIGTPGVYPDSFTVAAANNIVTSHKYTFSSNAALTAGGTVGSFTGEGLDDWHWNNDTTKEFELVSLGNNTDGTPKIGQLSDYDGLDVTGKIVLIQRGTLNLTTKVVNAQKKGAAGVIIYNQPNKAPLDNPVGFGLIPYTFISNEDGVKLEDAYKKLNSGGIGPGPGPGSYAATPKPVKFTITNDKLGSGFRESNAGQPTDFTSWGTTSDLLLKPEVMAPGHAIYSSVRVAADKHNTYENQDGTSMAAPYVAGAVADVMQGLIAKGYPTGTRAFAQLTKNLIMNTAIPAKRDYINEENGADRQDYMTEYQPRRQGAGMIRPDLALKSPVVVSGKDGKGSISLKEIGNTATFTLTAQNLSNKEVTYKVNGTVMTDYLKDAGKANSDNIRSRYLEDAKLTVDQKEITIPANSNKRVEVTVSLADSTVKNTFVEGYVYLTPTDDTLPTLNVPYNGFYGDWNEPSVIDNKDTNIWTASNLGTQLAVTGGGNYFTYQELFGQPTSPAQIALGDKYYVIPRGLYPVPALALLRSVRNLKVDVVDKDHNVVTHLSDSNWLSKGDPYTNGMPLRLAPDWTWYGWNEAVPVPDGQYYFAITATPDGPNPKPQKTMYMPMYIDTAAPKMNVVRSAGYDEKTKPETTDTGSYTVRWTMNDGDAGNVGGNVYMALNGSEQFSYKENVKQNADGSYELKVPGLVEGLNIIHVAPVDKAGNMGEAHVIIVNKTSKHAWIDLSTATLNDNPPSMAWEANVKPGDTFNLNFNAVGSADSVKSIQAVILRNYNDHSTIVGEPIDIDMTQNVTQKPYFGIYKEFSVKGKVTIPSTTPKGKYGVKYFLMAEGEKWTDPGVPAVGIQTYLDTDAPTITSLNTTSMKAFVKNDGDPVSLMLNASAGDLISNSRGFKVEFSVDGGAPKSMGANSNNSTLTQTFRYPVVLPSATGDDTQDTHTIKLIATDTLGNVSEYPFTVKLASSKVTLNYTLNGQSKTQDIAIQKVQSSSQTASITMKESLSSAKIYDANKVFYSEQGEPIISGYIQTPNGNLNSTDPVLAPILLLGNPNNRVSSTSIGYTKTGITSWNIPADSYYFQNQPTGYNDIGATPQGDSTFPITMVDFLGNETKIDVKIHKNAYIPKIKFDNGIIDHENNDTVTLFTYDSTYTLKGTVTASQDRFWAVMHDWNRSINGEKATFKNLFDNNSAWRENPVDNPATMDIPQGYEMDTGVRTFSFDTGELQPGANFFEIDGGSIVGSNPAHAMAGIHPLVKNIIVYRLGSSEGADQPLATKAANALTWDRIKGENKHQSLLVTNLALSTFDEANHAIISWNSSNTDVIKNDGTVIRPDQDTSVTLIATATVGGSTAVKTFNVTVAGKETNDDIAANEDSSNITWNIIRGENIDLNDLNSALSLPKFGSNGSRIEWTSDDVKHVTNQGRVYKPLFDEDDAHVELVAKITRNTTTVYKTFNVTVLKDTENKERTILLRAYHSLLGTDLLGDNKLSTEITKDLVLPTSYGNDGVSITWISTNPDVISPDGKVTRPSQNTGVSLTAIFRLGDEGIANEYSFYVRSEDTDTSAVVEAAKGSLVWNAIKKENTDQNAVTTNLNLPTTGNYDTTISWSSSDPKIISTDGKVNRQKAKKPGGRQVTLTATITKGTSSVTRVFDLTVVNIVDRTAPKAPFINNIDDNDLSISGKTEANAAVIVKNKTKVIGTGTADSNGVYRIKLVKQKAGTILTVYAKDEVGNQSTPSKTTVLDRTAPAKPIISSVKVTTKEIQVQGKAEANATVVVQIGKKVVKVKVASNGTFGVNLPKQKGKWTITAYAIDKAGNIGVKVTKTVTIK
ncbi:S8 family serine peptidase (plasmid) [Bacillus sp. F19]|nr:S8 family serine peptidase [Bacillus sp. F19]